MNYEVLASVFHSATSGQSFGKELHESTLLVASESMKVKVLNYDVVKACSTAWESMKVEVCRSYLGDGGLTALLYSRWGDLDGYLSQVAGSSSRTKL
jgi:hypothetical protein